MNLVENEKNICIVNEKGENITNINSQIQYFVKIGKVQRRKVMDYYFSQKTKTIKQLRFLEEVKKALDLINYDYLIPIIEPSQVDNKYCYYPGKPVCVGYSVIESEKKAKEYAPQFDSGIAKLEELYLWYAYRLAMGYWSISTLCDEINSVFSKKKTDEPLQLKLSGEQKYAGARDGIENTMKIVKYGEEFMLIGNAYDETDSLKSPIKWRSVLKSNEDKPQLTATPVIVLRNYSVL